MARRNSRQLELDQKADPVVREDSPIYACPRLKEVIIDAALKGEITTQEVNDLFVEYGLRGI